MTRVLLVTLYGLQNQGIRLLSAMLQREGFEAPVLYMKSWRNNDIHPPTNHELELFDDFVARTKPDIVGIGFGTPYLQIAKDLAHRIKKISRAHIISGGVHPTISPEDCIEFSDSVCIGEGEYPIVDLAKAIDQGQSIDHIENLWIRKGRTVIKNKLRPLICDLDDLPFDKLFDLETAVIDDDNLHFEDPLPTGAMYRVYASRGCPFKCAYCYNNQFRRIYKGLGPYRRIRSMESVIHEIETAHNAMPDLHRVHFDDDTFVFPMSWIEEFADVYPKRIGLPFSILLNPKALKEGALIRLREAGLIHAQVGIQSASKKELEEAYERHGTNAELLALAKKLRYLHIEATYDVILDNPLSTVEEKEALLDLLLEMPRPFNLFMYSLTHFPKAGVTDKLLEAGLLNEEEVEGRATKSFRQFRLSLDYPRPKEDTFFASLITLTSKSFIRRRWIQRLRKINWLRRHPLPLRYFAELANFMKLFGVAWAMFKRGELSVFKLREYASFRRRLIQ